MSAHDRYLQRALVLAKQNIADGGRPFGAVLVICGVLMLVSMFFPSLDLTLALQLSPLILVCLGVEVLLASRSGGKIRYDWVGMVLCFVLVTAALVFFGIAWCLVYHPEAVIHY